MKKSYNSEYKFKVAIEMIRGDMSVAEIIAKYQVPKSVLHKWKRELLENGAKIFKSPRSSGASSDNAAEINKLHATIGRLKVENDFLQQVSARLKL